MVGCSRRGTLVATGLSVSVMLGACADVLGLGSLHDARDGGSDVSTGIDSGSDATTTTDAANDGTTASDASDGSATGDANEASEATDATDASDASDAGQAPDVTDATSAVDASDASTDANEAAAIAACQAGCSANCMSCLVPGQLATCVVIPSGVDDSIHHCGILAVCDDSGTCVASAGKGHFGDACTVDSDCFGGACGAGTCLLANGLPCADDGACKSKRCVGNVCVACSTGPDCASGYCNAGSCLAPGGFLCGDAGDCASGSCYPLSYVCGDRVGCTVAGCITHYCSGGFCQTCSNSSQCPLQTACTGGSCLAPPGAFCRKGAECASGACGPAPFLGTATCQ
jgi:hypothetical protein